MSRGSGLGAKWSGRHIKRARAYCQRVYGWTCWICGHPITDPNDYSIDHVIERSLRPDLTFDPTNWRPAHLRKHDDLDCPGNSGRSNRRQAKQMPEWTLPGW